MSSEFLPLSHLDCLNRIYPITSAVVVGAGLGEGPWFDLFLQVDADLLLVEADAERCQHLEEMFAHQPRWIVKQQVAAAEEGERPFYVMATGAESGLISAKELLNLWPNLRLKEKHLCSTMTLDRLCLQNDFSANWLILDCLFSYQILQGAETVLRYSDVVVVRLIADDDLSAEGDSSQRKIDVYLKKQGFQFFGVQPERNPALIHAVYLRGHAKQFSRERIKLEKELQEYNKTLLEEKDNLIKKLEGINLDLNEQFQDLTEQRDMTQKQVQELTQKLDAQNKKLEAHRQHMQSEKEQMEQQVEDRDEKLDQKEKSLLELREAKSTLDEKLKSCTEELDAKQKQLLELTQQRDAQSKELEEVRQQLKKVQSERDQNRAEIKDFQQEKQCLEERIQETNHRQQQLLEELALAEGQIVLIRDLLLREERI